MSKRNHVYRLGPSYEVPQNLPKGWTSKQLGQLVQIVQGGRLGLTKENDYVSSGVSAFSAAGQDGYVEKVEFRNQAGVILSAIGANCGRCFYAKGNWSTLANVQALLPISNLNAKLLFYRTNVENYWERSGSAQPFIKPSSIKKAWIGFPEDEVEQQRIAEILSSVDEAIEQTEALIAKTQAIKTGLMHDLFTRGVLPNGRLRPPREEAPQLYKQSPLGWIPKEWEVSTIGTVSQLVTSGSRGWAVYYSDDGPLFIRIGNLTREHPNLRFDDVVHVRPPASSEGQRARLEVGDVLMSITADLGIVGVVPPDLGEAYINQHIALIRPNIEMVNPRWLGHLLAGHRARRWVQRLDDPGAKAGLNLPAVRAFPIVIPARDECNEVVARLDAADNSICRARNSLRKMHNIKNGLMHDLLTGKVRVEVKQSEEASA